MYIGSRIRIYVHIILYTYTVCHCTASSPRSLGGRTSAERLITFGDRRNYDYRPVSPVLMDEPRAFSQRAILRASVRGCKTATFVLRIYERELGTCPYDPFLHI